MYPVGVFAQITSVFGSGDAVAGDGKERKEGEKETLTAVLYPHRRIRIDELLTERPKATMTDSDTEAVKGLEVPAVPAEVPAMQHQNPASEVASFELEETPTSEQVKEDLAATNASTDDTPPMSTISFLHPLLPNISLTNVSNLKMEPYKRDSQMIRAVMNELLSVFKDIAQLAPIFREQSECERWNWSWS